jgi:hypothetical protein
LLPDVQVLMKRSGAAAPLLETIRNSAARTQRPGDSECQDPGRSETAERAPCAPPQGR